MLDDGRQKENGFMKYSYDGKEEEGVVVWTAEDGEVGRFEVDKLSTTQQRAMLLWGVHHRLRNAIAGAKGRTDAGKLERAREAWDVLVNHGRKLPAFTLAALCKLMQEEEGVMRERLRGMEEERVRVMLTHPSVRAMRAKLELEALEARATDGEGTLDSLF